MPEDSSKQSKQTTVFYIWGPISYLEALRTLRELGVRNFDCERITKLSPEDNMQRCMENNGSKSSV